MKWRYLGHGHISILADFWNYSAMEIPLAKSWIFSRQRLTYYIPIDWKFCTDHFWDIKFGLKIFLSRHIKHFFVFSDLTWFVKSQTWHVYCLAIMADKDSEVVRDIKEGFNVWVIVTGCSGSLQAVLCFTNVAYNSDVWCI